MEIEAGKYYLTRDGNKVGPMVASPITDRTFHVLGKQMVWEKGGKSWISAHHDIISEWVTSDNVNSPSHYNQAGIECIDAIKASLGDGYQDYCKGNVMKYLWRYKYKNGIEDLKKAQWYLNSMVESVALEESMDNK